MFKLDYTTSKPIYEQIKDNIKKLIISGALNENDKLMSVRELAVEMAINPNTIQKAYKELELEGYIYSIMGKGYFVSQQCKAENDKKLISLNKELAAIIKEMQYFGIEKDDLFKIIDEIYEGR